MLFAARWRSLDLSACAISRARVAIAGLTSSAISTLTADQIAALSSTQIAALTAKFPFIAADNMRREGATLALALTGHGLTEHLIAGHVSAEGAHARLLRELGLDPILDLGLRLGEGSGAALAIPVLRAAAACLSEMATFAEAGVSGG